MHAVWYTLSTEEWDKIIQDELKMLEAVQED